LFVLGQVIHAENAESEAPKKPTRLFRSVQQIITSMPKEVGPRPNKGWDKYNFPDAVKWLNENIPGNKFKGSFRLHQVIVAKNARSTSEKDEWLIRILPTSNDFRYRNVKFKGRLRGSSALFYLVGDEAFAKRCEKLPQGRIISVDGTIKEIKLHSYIKYYSCELILAEYKLPTVK